MRYGTIKILGVLGGLLTVGIVAGTGVGIGYAMHKDVTIDEYNELMENDKKGGMGRAHYYNKTINEVNNINKKDRMITGGIVGSAIGLVVGFGVVQSVFSSVKLAKLEEAQRRDMGLRKMFASRGQSKVGNIGNSEGFKMSENPMYQDAAERRNAVIAAREKAAREEADDKLAASNPDTYAGRIAKQEAQARIKEANMEIYRAQNRARREEEARTERVPAVEGRNPLWAVADHLAWTL
jgi:hypothetical protein